MCSVERGRDRWACPRTAGCSRTAGTDCHEHSVRLQPLVVLPTTPAIALGGRRALELAGVGIDDVAHRRPVLVLPVRRAARRAEPRARRSTASSPAPAACRSPAGRGTTTSMHAHRHDGRRPARRPGDVGLVWANGGYTTKHAFGVYSTTPPDQPASATPTRRPRSTPCRAGSWPTPADAAGPATIEAYTVMHARDGEPETAIAACLLADGRRAGARRPTRVLAAAMCDGEWVGREAELAPTARSPHRGRACRRNVAVVQRRERGRSAHPQRVRRRRHRRPAGPPTSPSTTA